MKHPSMDVHRVMPFCAGGVAVAVDAPGDLDLQFIYRAARFVYWNPEQSRLEDRCEHEVSQVASFSRIAAALRDEYGVGLRLHAGTRWDGIDADARRVIEEEAPW
jgi:hypothetical protein